MKIEIIIIGMLIVSLSGCINSNVYPGTFELDNPPTKTLELREDGTYLLIIAKEKYSQKGTYVRRGDKLELTGALGFTGIVNITDKGLEEGDGSVRIRVPMETKTPLK